MRQAKFPLTQPRAALLFALKNNQQTVLLAEMRSGSLSSWFGRSFGEPISAVHRGMEQRENHRRERKG